MTLRNHGLANHATAASLFATWQETGGASFIDDYHLPTEAAIKFSISAHQVEWSLAAETRTNNLSSLTTTDQASYSRLWH